MHAGDALTLARLVATPVFVWSFRNAVAGSAPCTLAAVVFVAVCLSDCFDGVLARRAGRASARGRILDGAADIVFLLAALGAASVMALVPWWVPAAVAAAFAFYVADSWLLTRRDAEPNLVGSRIGHLGGICNYALVGVLTFNHGCGLAVLGPGAMRALFYLVPVYSAAAIGARLCERYRGGRRA